MPKIPGACPGQNPAYLKDFNTNLIPCPKCGHEIEFFSDEKKVKCPKCKNNVFKVNPDMISYENGKLYMASTAGNCLDWCGSCLDAKDYKDISENNKRIDCKNKDFKKFIESIDKSETEVIEFFIDAFKKSINHPKLIDQKIFDMLAKENTSLFIKARDYYINYFKRLNL